MDDLTEQSIRERAYALWEKEGSPEGRDREFWERAQLMLEAASATPIAAATVPDLAADREIDIAMEDTFPASDPPAFTADVGTGLQPR